MQVNNIGNTSFTFEFSIFEETAGRPIATGHIVAVAINKASRARPVSRVGGRAVENERSAFRA